MHISVCILFSRQFVCRGFFNISRIVALRQYYLLEKDEEWNGREKYQLIFDGWKNYWKD